MSLRSPAPVPTRNLAASPVGGALCLCVALLYGCAVVPVPWPQPQAAQSQLHAGDALKDFSGVIHIHTAPDSSDASGTLAKAIRVAQAQGLDYLLITEHNTLQGRERGREGRYGKLVVLIGEEISTPDGHLLALDVAQHVSRYQATSQIAAQIVQQGGFSIVAHPVWARKHWERWDLPELAGMEIYNVAHDVMEEHRLRLLLWWVLLPPEVLYQSVIDRPYDALRQWDELTATRRFVGIGGADAHEQRFLGLTIGPYEMLFRMVRTHLLAPALAPEDLYAALRQGHAYIALETERPAAGFRFLLRRDGRAIGLMGDELPWEQGMELVAEVPAPARIMLWRDGQVIAATAGKRLSFSADRPGVYRVEVEVNNRPWIFSNPIYLRAPVTTESTLP